MKSIRIFSAVLTLTFAVTLVGPTNAETRLFVPQFSSGPQQETQFLLVNGNDHDSKVDFWAFTLQGKLLGQFQVLIRPHSTRSLTLKEVFQSSEAFNGWIGAVSNDERIGLSYSLVSQRDGRSYNESYDAVERGANDFQQTLEDPSRQMFQISNPNAFVAQVTLIGLDQTGGFLAARDLTVAPFAQLNAGVGELLGDASAGLDMHANAEVLTSVGYKSSSAIERPVSDVDVGAEVQKQQLALVVETAQTLGAYQVKLRFDPEAVQFTVEDVVGGLAEGFQSRPLAVSIDNAAGELTLASFQVGSSPTGRITVARISILLRTHKALQFGIQVDEVSDSAGTSLPAADVGVGLIGVAH